MDRAVDSVLGMKGNMKTKRNKDNKRIRRLKENAVEQCQGATRISKNYVGEIKNKKETESTEFCTLGFFFICAIVFTNMFFRAKIYFPLLKYIFQCTSIFSSAQMCFSAQNYSWDPMGCH